MGYAFKFPHEAAQVQRSALATIESALHDAKKAHAQFESDYLNGVFHARWSGFYAAFLLGRLGPIMGAGDLARMLESITTPATPESWFAVAAVEVLAFTSNADKARLRLM